MTARESGTLLIRADAGVRMGTGHVMRCLGLAQAWQDTGGSVVYAIAAEAPGISERLLAERMGIQRLDVEPGSPADAAATTIAAQTLGCAWCVLDGYHFDAAYQRSLMSSGLRLLVLDDFGAQDRYGAEIVLNQDPIAEEQMYANRGSRTRLLLGPEYAFLRREFLRWPRPQRETPPLARRLLVTMGGSDPDNVTGVVLRALNGVAVDGMETAVLVGPSNPHGSHLAVAVAESRAHVRLLRNPPNIPEWMAWCDLAITAGGSTLWELAYFHVPAIVILTAENQEPAMMRLDRNGACRCLGYGARLSAGTIAVAVESLCGDPTARAALAAGLAATTDGRGAQRVLAAMRQGDGSSEVEIVREAQRVP